MKDLDSLEPQELRPTVKDVNERLNRLCREQIEAAPNKLGSNRDERDDCPSVIESPAQVTRIARIAGGHFTSPNDSSETSSHAATFFTRSKTLTKIRDPIMKFR